MPPSSTFMDYCIGAARRN
ncbi:hypothetical protein JL09_g5514 [Pichia kudriavzevii]|uniref:Uncharacterized protein n=1 Tax=Pichia kudriavzevii TaxID=4909 RepID=A0A099NTX9_PICKU|nr:hypothetical protein JL09_g5514 [Pichia kudriavzevii]